MLAGISAAGRILKGELAGEAAEEAEAAAAGNRAAIDMASNGMVVAAGAAGRGTWLAPCRADAVGDLALTPGSAVGNGDSCGNQKSGVVITQGLLTVPVGAASHISSGPLGTGTSPLSAAAAFVLAAGVDKLSSPAQEQDLVSSASSRTVKVSVHYLTGKQPTSNIIATCCWLQVATNLLSAVPQQTLYTHTSHRHPDDLTDG